ncbi:MAG: gliding motility-associated C-terminal domain-containing protein, partial [Bacteroidota bacterium]
VDSVTLTQPDTLVSTLISPTFNGGYNVTCLGNDGSIDLTVTGGTAPFDFVWSNGATTEDLTGLSAGTYDVTVTDVNGCTSTGSITLTQSTALNLAASLSTYNGTNISCNGNSDGSIDLTVTGGATPYTYAWSNGATTEDLSNLGAGTYTVTVTDANNCSTTASSTITEPTPLTSPTVSSSYNGGYNIGCNGSVNGSIDLTPTGGTSPYSYNWSNGETTEDLSNLGAGTYGVTVTDLNGCTVATSITLTEPDSLNLIPVSPTFSGGYNVTCVGNDGSIDLTVTGGVAPYTYHWNTGATTEDLTGIGAGTFTVTVTDANGCTSEASITLTQSGNLSATLTPSSYNENGVSCFGSTDGYILTTVTGGAIPYAYLWSNGATTSTITGLGAGIYTVTITDANGCNAIATEELTQPDVLTVSSAVVTNIACNSFGNGSIDITVTGGTQPPYFYAWSNGATTEDLSNLNVGTYSVTVTDVNGCSFTDSYDITEPNTLTATATSSSSPSCFGANNGAIDLTVSGGTAAYTYNWSNGATTEDLSGLTGGTFSVTVTDANGCTAVMASTITLVEPLVLTVTPVVQNVSCNGNDDGSISLTVAGGTAAYIYLWSNGSGAPAITNLSPGTYDVTVTDANGCTATASATITEPLVLTASLVSYTDTLGCNAVGTGAIDISVSGGTIAYTYSWSDGSTTQDLTGLGAGTYNVTVTDANGCTTTLTTDLIIVQVNHPIASTTTTNVTGCFGNSNGAIDLSVTDGQAPFTYSWSNGTTTQDLSGLTAGTYDVTVIDVNGCSTTTSATITEPALLVATVSPSSTNVTCNGAADGTVILGVSGGTPAYNYNWSNGSTTSSLSNLSPGTYDVTVTDANGCTATTTSTITEPPVLTASFVSYTDTLGCNAVGTGTIDISVSGGTPAYSYFWSNGATTEDLSNLGAGVYDVTVTDANGCTAVLSSALTIVQVDHPIANSVVTDVTGCFGNANGSIDLTITDGQAPFTFTFTWSNGTTTEDLSGLTAGTYSVTVVDVNGCSTTTSATVTEPQLLVAAVSGASTDVTCNGACDGTVVLTITGGTPAYNYQWSNGATTSSLLNLCPGTYDVTVTDANGCTATISGTVIEPPVLTITVDALTDTLGCNAAGTGSIDISVTGGTAFYSYSWSNGATTQDLSSLGAGTYDVTVTDAHGCTTSLSASLTIVQVSSPIATTAVTNVTGCFGNANGAIDLTVTNGQAPFTYTWSNGVTTQDLTNLAIGTYNVTVVDVNGCSTTSSGTVTQPTQVSAASIVATNVTCFGLDNGFIDLTPSGGTPGYTFNWSSGATTEDISGLSPGVYDVTVTDANGCTATGSANITEPNLLMIMDTVITNVTCSGNNNGGIDISIMGGTPAYSYSWSNGTTTEDLSNIGGGTYYVTVTDVNNCMVSDSFTVTEPTPLVAALSISDSIYCAGVDPASIDLTVSGGTTAYTFSWSNGATTEDLTNVPAGNYTVTVTDANGCTAIGSKVVTQPQQLSAIASQSQAVNCNGNATGQAVIVGLGGTAPYTYSWTTGETNDTLSNVTAGTYQVTVTDAHGCADTTSVVITEPAVLDVTLGSVTDVNCQNLLSGAIDINVSGGTVPYIFIWSNGATTEDISSVGAGTYAVTVVDLHGCSDTLSAIIDPAIAVTATINVVDTVSCNGGSDGNLSVSTSGGTSPFNYTWSNGATTQSIANLSGGTYTVTVTDATGCSAVQAMQLADPAVPNFSGGGTTDVCGSDGTLTGTLPNGYTGIWTLHSGTGNIDDPNSQVTSVSSLGSGTNVFYWTISNGTCTYLDSATLQTTVLVIDAGNDQSTCDTTNLQLAGSQSSGSGIWSSPDNGITFSNPNDPSATASGFTVGPNIVIWTVTDGNCIEIDTLIITIKPPEECVEDSLEMPTGFSPNGDGPNDFFVIHGLVRYPDNELKVFNRWGNLVYEKKNYNNEWDGTNNSGDKLPDGTYFAIFNVTGQPTLTLTGYVDMRR